ncbi:MAG: cobalt-precorrin 5A hydrolase [Lachnospiraceae bacterium]|nr:cobalt-precorrin 5A hydrolase [Lachnospiraceae bacterium]
MQYAFLVFTRKGEELADFLADSLGGLVHRCGPALSLMDWTAAHFDSSDALIFVGAAGIAVRAIAPFVESKTTDPAVVVVDEAGRYAIPLLSGHLGGANDLAREIAALLGGEAVITTATDVRGVFAVDDWARKQGCAVLRPERIKVVSGRLLAGQTIRLWSKWEIAGRAPEGVVLCETPGTCDVALTVRRDDCDRQALLVVPRILVLGVGCRKGISADQLEQFFERFMAENGYLAEGIRLVSSLDRKAEEPGLQAFCKTHAWPFETFRQAELAALEGSFTASSYVEQVTGLDNVCERSAVKGSGGELVCPKKAGEGITMALAQAFFCPAWEEEQNG